MLIKHFRIKSKDVRIMKKKMYNIRELRAICQDKGNGKFYSDWSEYIPRSISIYFTKLFIFLGIKPNHVTFLSVLLGLISAFFLSFNNYIFIIIAGVIFLFALIGDYCDGELARYYKMQSYTGCYADRMGAAIIYPPILFALGINLFQETTYLPDLGMAFIGGCSFLWLRIAISYPYSSFLGVANNAGSKTITIQNIEIKKPKVMLKSKFINFFLDLFLIKAYGIIFWIWGVVILSIFFIILNYNYPTGLLFRPLIWGYGISGPIAVIYAIHTTIKSKLPDKLIK